MKPASAIVLFIVLISVTASATFADVVEIGAMKDNTLYESAGGSLSNGAGKHLFAGVTGASEIRRGLIVFDVATVVPPSAKIDNVTLTLNMSKTISGVHPVALHRGMADWGEGASDAGGEEGAGAPAEAADATWLHTFFPSDFWIEPGGDFERVASAETDVGPIGSYTWSSAAMAADVQSWLDRPGDNHGWVVVGHETSAPTAKRFDSRDHEDAAVRPVLTVEFTAGDGDGGGDGVPASSGPTLILAALLLLLCGSAVVQKLRAPAPPAKKSLGPGGLTP